MRRRERAGGDSTAWIGFSDFFLTLAILFFVVAVGFGLEVTEPRSAFVAVAVSDSIDGVAIPGCRVTLSDAEPAVTDSAGMATLAIDSLVRRGRGLLMLECPGVGGRSRLTEVIPGATTDERFDLARERTIVVFQLPGDVLFQQNVAEFAEGGVDSLVRLGAVLRQQLGDEDILVVEGHTDEDTFSAEVPIDNWWLAGTRAARAVRVLDSMGIDRCQLSFIGYGASRPLEAVSPTDGPAERMRKNRENRRVEFRIRRGAREPDCQPQR